MRIMKWNKERGKKEGEISFKNMRKERKRKRILPFTLFEFFMMLTNVGIITSIWVTFILSNII